MLTLLNFIVCLVTLLASVAFYTMLERSVLSYIQTRKGPNKVGILGLMQPFSDAIKLFNKPLPALTPSNPLLYLISPLLSFLLALAMVTILLMNTFTTMDNKQNVLMFLVLSSLSVYAIILVGWSSNSKYSSLGTIRNIAQMISYEVALFLIILFIALLTNSYNFKIMQETQTFLAFSVGNPLLLLAWLLSCLAEVNRTPFDFAEGESELVSGFNVEFMGGLFAMIFLAEYTNMLILSLITCMIFMGGVSMMKTPLLLLITAMFLWARGTLPRFRYDLLMTLNWKILLPLVLLISPSPLLFLTQSC